MIICLVIALVVARAATPAIGSSAEMLEGGVTEDAASYVGLFCEAERLKSQCDILKRQINSLESDLSVRPQNKVVSSNGPEPQLPFQAEIDSILADARVVTLPIMTAQAVSQGSETAAQLDKLKSQWVPIRASLSGARSANEDPKLEMAAEDKWTRSWSDLRPWYWLCCSATVFILLVYLFRQFRRDFLRIVRSSGALTSITVVGLVLAACTLLAFTSWKVVTWAEGASISDNPTSIRTDAPTSGSTDLRKLRLLHKKAGESYTSCLSQYQTLSAAWQNKVISTTPFAALLPSRVQEFRHAIWKNEADLSVILAVGNQFNLDIAELNSLQEKISQKSQREDQQVREIAYRHVLISGCLLALSAVVVLSLVYFRKYRSVNNASTCPACGVAGKLVGGPPPPTGKWWHLWRRIGKTTSRRSTGAGDDIVAVPMLRCGANIKGKACEYKFALSYAALPRLTIPTCGAAQIGKTMWLAMVYQRLTQKTSQTRTVFERIQSRHGDDLDAAIENIIRQRKLPGATVTDRIPRPLIFKARDSRWFADSSVLLSLLDFPGEMTNAWSIDDSRKRRAMQVNGILYFLDPTKSHSRQMSELQGFIQDLRLVRKTPDGHPESIPMAICLCKIDELVRMGFSNGQKQITGFFEKLRKTDPGDHAPTLKTVRARSKALQALWEDIWPGWKIATLVKDEFRGPHQFFPLTPIGLEHGNDTESELGKADLRKRTLAPFGLLEPLLWLMYVNGVDAL